MVFNQESRGAINTVDMLSHHDVVFKSPMCDPLRGIPIGDGETGCLLWVDKDLLHMQINNSGFVDDVSEGAEYCSETNETMTFCRNGARLDINLGCPVFEAIYQDTFEARLSIGDATAYIKADTPFAKVRIRAFSAHSNKVTVLSLDADFCEPVPVRSELSRWGSRALMRWYSSFHADTGIGLSGTSSQIEEGCLCIVQKLHGINFCIMAKPVCDECPEIHRMSLHGLEAYFTGKEHVSQTYYISIAIGEDIDEIKTNALRHIRDAERIGTEEIYRTHAQEWESFWNKSYVSLSEKQDYVENLWYLNLYYANSQMRGAYPAHFCNGVWGSYHDFVPWGGVFHYNTQHSIFPLEAANHPELTDTYFRFRRNQLPYARRFAENIRNGKGAFYTDVCDIKGRMDRSTKDNCTPESQIAMEMYQHYLYTKDKDFLENVAIPVMQGAAEYYLDKLVLADDGHYHIYGTNGYESPFVMLDDSITDLAMIRALFAAYITVAPSEEGRLYQERLERLVPYQTTDFLEEELDADGRFLWGIGKGRKALANSVLSVGDRPRLPDGLKVLPEYAQDVMREVGKEKARKVYGNMEHSYYGFPDTEMAPLFPASTVGIRNRDSELYKMIHDSICLHPKICMSWCMMPIYMARMGMADLLEEQLERTVSSWMVYPQGFGYDKELNHYWMQNKIRNDRTGEFSTSRQWKFNNFDYETLPIIATAVNEMLIQSYDGTIRLFPAIREDREVSFKLAATGGRIVNAVYRLGECDVVIECASGGRLTIAADHINRPLVFSDAESGSPLLPVREEEFYILETVSGQCIRAKTENTDNLTISKDYLKNMDVKCFREVKLGAEREF